MRSRLASLTTAATLCVALTACGGAGGKITLSDAAPASTAPAADTAETTVPSPDDTTSETAGTVPGAVPGAPLDLAACTELAGVLSSMAMAATGSPVPDEMTSQIEEVRAGLPDDVRADLDVVIDAYAKLGESTDFMDAAESINTAEFQAASERLGVYFEQSCAG